MHFWSEHSVNTLPHAQPKYVYSEIRVATLRVSRCPRRFVTLTPAQWVTERNRRG